MKVLHDHDASPMSLMVVKCGSVFRPAHLIDKFMVKTATAGPVQSLGDPTCYCLNLSNWNVEAVPSNMLCMVYPASFIKIKYKEDGS